MCTKRHPVHPLRRVWAVCTDLFISLSSTPPPPPPLPHPLTFCGPAGRSRLRLWLDLVGVLSITRFVTCNEEEEDTVLSAADPLRPTTAADPLRSITVAAAAAWWWGTSLSGYSYFLQHKKTVT